MALLQIAEPGQSLAPHQRRIAVGIDLGTTNSLVAAMKNALPEVLADEQGRKLLPSVIRYLPGGTTQAGYQALQNANGDPKNTIISVKRFMGRGLSDIQHAQTTPLISSGVKPASLSAFLAASKVLLTKCWVNSKN